MKQGGLQKQRHRGAYAVLLSTSSVLQLLAGYVSNISTLHDQLGFQLAMHVCHEQPVCHYSHTQCLTQFLGVDFVHCTL
jgi:hypothetical protein